MSDSANKTAEIVCEVRQAPAPTELITKPLTQSRLLALAAELRNGVWEICVAEDADSIVQDDGNDSTSSQAKAAFSSLALVNHQIRSEVSYFFFSRNTFTLEANDSLDSHAGIAWLLSVGANIENLRSLRLKLCCNHPSDVIVKLKDGLVVSCSLDFEGSHPKCYLRKTQDHLSRLDEVLREPLAKAEEGVLAREAKPQVLLAFFHGKHLYSNSQD